MQNSYNLTKLKNLTFAILCVISVIIQSNAFSVDQDDCIDNITTTPYFADIIINNEFQRIVVELDVNLIQETSSDVRVEAKLINSSGKIVASENPISFTTFYEDKDYINLVFTPPDEDIYLLALILYSQKTGTITDSRLINVIFPPGTGAFFKKYDASAIGKSIKVNFDVDLYYSTTDAVSVEAILYNSKNDPIAYENISYFTYETQDDEKSLLLTPKETFGDSYYVELIVYINNYPSSFGYITDLSMQ